MKLIIEINETSYEWLKNTIRPDVIKNYDEIHEAVRHGKPLQEELEEIKAEINEYLIASFADDEDFRWFNLCLDTHIKESKNE